MNIDESDASSTWYESVKPVVPLTTTINYMLCGTVARIETGTPHELIITLRALTLKVISCSYHLSKGQKSAVPYEVRTVKDISTVCRINRPISKIMKPKSSDIPPKRSGLI